NQELESLFTTSFEIGTDLRFLDSRIGLDLTYYSGSTTNQILSTIVDASSGMRRAIVNAGKVGNSGFELAINGSPLIGLPGLKIKVFNLSL
ncbi:MAG: TonB-dependent receptor, partial [Pedobacter sp.]